MSGQSILLVVLVAIIGFSVSGTTIAGLKGFRVSVFFGVLLSLSLPGVVIGSGDDTVGGTGYLFLFLLLVLGWAPVVGTLGIARPGSWWYRHRYDDTAKFTAHTKYNRLHL